MAQQTHDHDITRIPPQSLDAEMAVLGGMMMDRSAADRVFAMVKLPDAFYKQAHRKIFAAAMDLFARNIEIDMLTVSNELETRGDLESVGGRFYMTELVEQCPSAANIEHHIKIVLDKASLRDLIVVGREIADLGYRADMDPAEIIRQADERVYQLTRLGDGQKGFVPFVESLSSTIELLEKRHADGNKIVGIPTGFKKLDEKLAGMQKKEVYILAARPSMGKTAMAMNIAKNAASNGYRVGIFSLETIHENLTMRQISASSKINLINLRTGLMDNMDWQKISHTMGSLADTQIWLQDKEGLTVQDIRSQSRQLVREHNIDLIIIDYLQLLSTGHDARHFGYNRNLEISFISQQLKWLAKELNVAVLELSQLSREVERRANTEPILPDLRDSGAIEQDAYCVMFIHRPEMYSEESIQVHKKTEDPKDWAKIIIAKHKDGPTGALWLRFMPEYTRFMDPVDYDLEKGPAQTDWNDQF